MAVEITTVGRTRVIAGVVRLIRWVQADAGTAVITATRNSLNTAANTRATEATVGQAGGLIWFGAPSPGEFDGGDTHQDWYGREIIVPFKLMETASQTSTFEEDIKTWIYGLFPGEDIQDPNRRFDFPELSGDLSNPAKCLDWELEF